MPTRSDALGSASLLGRRFPAFIDRYWPKLDDPRIQNRGSDEPDTGQHPGLRCTQGCASTRTGRAYVGRLPAYVYRFGRARVVPSIKTSAS